MSVRILIVLLCAGFALAGCAPQASPKLAYSDGAERPYLLDSGDKLRITVFGQENLTNVYTVEGGGHIAMPLIGAVKARGTSVRQLEAAITHRLASGFLRNPNVTVAIEAYRPFFILGEVRNPGQYPYVDGMTVQTAAAIAGGFTPRARESSVEITRQLDGRVVHGRVPSMFPIRPGDTINVEERLF